jgi:hypothetical protein
MVALTAIAFAVPGSVRAQASADPIKLAVSAIGRPPIFSNTFVDVGEAMGYFKASGVDVTFRWFQRGADTARAVVTGDVAVGFTATQPALNLIAGGAPVVVIAGMPNQDWLVATDDPEVKSCKDLKGKTVAADGINNSRTLYITAVVATCGLKQADLKLIDLANQPLVRAGIAGQVHSGVCRRARPGRVQDRKEVAHHRGPGVDREGAALRGAAHQQEGDRGEPGRAHPLSRGLDPHPEPDGEQIAGRQGCFRDRGGQCQPDRLPGRAGIGRRLPRVHYWSTTTARRSR